jgi:5-formyltetrahydrofolate cyclo-ligase
MMSRRDLMPETERRAASARIAATVAPMLTDGVIALYAPKSTEVATSAIDADVRARGLRIAYPRVVAGTRVLEFAEGELAPGSFGLLEPRGPALSLDAITAFVIPGIAFDREGGRIGWGRGYYDATLAQAHGLRIGLAFDCQLVEAIPRDAHDIGVNIVVTETASYGRR